MNVRKFIIIPAISILYLLLTYQRGFCHVDYKVESAIQDNSILNQSDVFNPGSNYEIALPTNIRDIIKNNRYFSAADNDAVKEFASYLYKFKSFSDEPQDFEYSKVERPDNANSNNTLDRESILQDLDYFFGTMNYSYAGYQYFGGDKAFNTARGNIIKAVDKYKYVITRTVLAKIISENLSFVQDSHFSVDNYRTAKKYYYLSNNDYHIQKDSAGFFSIFGNEKYYVDKINGDSYKNYIKPTLAENGILTYEIGTVEPVFEKNVKITFKSVNKHIERLITLSYRKPDSLSHIGYDRSEINGITILTNRRMYLLNENKDELDDFVNDASTLNSLDIFILDIRGNNGGQDTYPINWYKNLTGNYPSYGPKLFCSLGTRLCLQHEFVNLQNGIYRNTESRSSELKTSIRQMEAGKLKEGWDDIINISAETYKNKTFVIVLMDGYTASSGESFINYLRSLENVIFIGTNSAGAFLIGNNNLWALPNSGIQIFSGRNINLPPSLKNTDGMGFQPDIWVNSQDIVSRAILFAKKYKIKQ